MIKMINSVIIQDIRPVFAILAPQILSDWKFVLRRLGVTEKDILDVTASNRDRKPAEIVYRGLIRWEEFCMGSPSLDNLIRALKDLRLNDAADTIAKYRVVPRLNGLSEGPRPRRVRRNSGSRPFLMTDRKFGDAQKSYVHPIATYRDPAPGLNLSFDQATYPTTVIQPTFFSKRHSWSSDHHPLLQGKLHYTYVSQVISPTSKFEREPWFTAVDFLANGDVILLDRENRQIEVHQCRVLPNCRRFVFSHSFKICKDIVDSEPWDMAIYGSYIIIIDKGQRFMRIFTSDGKNAGSVKFRNQPRCITVVSNTFAIAFWDVSIGKGSIVLYKAAIEKVPGHGKKLTLVSPRNVDSATLCYDSVAINSFGDIIALTENGSLYLYSIKNALHPIYVCRNEAVLPRIRNMVVKGNVVIVCNTYQDNINAIGLTPNDPRTFDLSNLNTVLSDDDGLYGPRAMAFYDNDLVVVHRYGADVRVFGSVTWSKPRNGLVTFRL